MTTADVLFSTKAIKNPEVDAPHLRNYFLSIVDARDAGEGTIEFEAAEPYFLNESILGESIPILPRHYYDPDGELEGISVRELADWRSISEEKRERAVRFATMFNREFHRRILGAGGYELRDPENNLITGERLVLDRRATYWAPGDPLRGDGWVDRMFFRVINDQNAALVVAQGRDARPGEPDPSPAPPPDQHAQIRGAFPEGNRLLPGLLLHRLEPASTRTR